MINLIDYDPSEQFWKVEIPLEKVEVHWNEILGAGFFGLVVKGKYTCLDVVLKFPIIAELLPVKKLEQ